MLLNKFLFKSSYHNNINCVNLEIKGRGKRSHKGCNPDIPVLDLTIVTVKLKFTVSHICDFIMLTKSCD